PRLPVRGAGRKRKGQPHVGLTGRDGGPEAGGLRGTARAVAGPASRARRRAAHRAFEGRSSQRTVSRTPEDIDPRQLLPQPREQCLLALVDGGIAAHALPEPVPDLTPAPVPISAGSFR